MRVERIQPEYLPRELRLTDKEIGWDKAGRLNPSETNDELKSVAKEEEFNREELMEKVDKLNAAMDLFNRKFNFKVHEETNRVIVQILDSKTGEIINEIPPKKVLDMVAGMDEAIGLIVDAKV